MLALPLLLPYAFVLPMHPRTLCVARVTSAVRMDGENPLDLPPAVTDVLKQADLKDPSAMSK